MYVGVHLRSLYVFSSLQLSHSVFSGLVAWKSSFSDTNYISVKQSNVQFVFDRVELSFDVLTSLKG